MFEMQKVGIKIAKLRKSNNMTQTELADKMGVSFQAVSNWERGNSMPDISKLPELAETFNVSIDEILGENSDFVDAAINNEIGSYLKKNKLSGEELENAVPILKPVQLKEIAENADKATLTGIPELFGYMSANDVYELAMEMAGQGKSVGVSFLEHMSSADVSRLAIYEYKNNKPVDIYLEYMDSAGVKELALWEIAKGKPFNGYLKYMSSSDVFEVAVEAAGREKFDISVFAEKMSAQDMGKLAIMEYRKGRPVIDFLEYIDSDSLKTIMRDII